MIDIGCEVIDRAFYWAFGWTIIMKGNPANASGTIDTVEIWANKELVGCKVGIFYTTDGGTLKCRSSATLGTVVSGSKQTFNGLSLPVETRDYIGMYYSAGSMERSASGGGYWRVAGDYCDVGDEIDYTYTADTDLSLYGTGKEAVPPVSKRGWWSK
ncbi:hypothetical protein ES708_26084 [subsurface metagenome]